MGTIDEHLREQARFNASFLATIEAIPEDSELVRVTPYFGGSCACQSAMRMRKKDLEVEPTATTTMCCGKWLRVFRVHLVVGAQVPAADFVRHLQSVSPQRQSRCAKDCKDAFDACIDAAGDDQFQRQQCSEDYGWCIEDCKPAPRSRARASSRDSCNCEALYARLSMLQEMLRSANPGDKPSILRRIDQVWAQLDACGC